MDSRAAYYGYRQGHQPTQQQRIDKAMQEAAAAKAERLAETQRQLRAVQEQIRKSEAAKPAPKKKANEAEVIALAAVGGGAVLTAAAIWHTVKLAVVVIGGFYLLAHLPYVLLVMPAVVLIGGLLLVAISGELG
jgi:Flp pilus assembly protein TadB